MSWQQLHRLTRLALCPHPLLPSFLSPFLDWQKAVTFHSFLPSFHRLLLPPSVQLMTVEAVTAEKEGVLFPSVSPTHSGVCRTALFLYSSLLILHAEGSNTVTHLLSFIPSINPSLHSTDSQSVSQSVKHPLGHPFHAMICSTKIHQKAGPLNVTVKPNK